jgi:hypothetical protein
LLANFSKTFLNIKRTHLNEKITRRISLFDAFFSKHWNNDNSIS